MTAGRIADKIGRMPVMKIAAVLFLISAFGTGFRPRGLDAGGVPHRRRHRRRRRLGDRAVPTSPRPRRRGSAAGSVRCNSWRSCRASSCRSRSTICCSGLAGGPERSRCGSGWRPGAGCSSRWRCPRSLYGVLAFTIPESPRYLVANPQDSGGPPGLNMLLGEKNLEITIDRIQESLERENKPSLARLEQADRRHLRHRLGGSRAVDLPAVRRHQRDLLLLQRPVAGGRIQRRRARRSISP